MELTEEINKIVINDNTNAEINESERLGKSFRNIIISQGGQGDVIGKVTVGEDELRYLVRKLARPKNKKDK